MSTDKKKWIVEIPTFFTAEDIENIMVGAIEGGINYWLGSIGNVMDGEDVKVFGKGEQEPRSIFLSNELLMGNNVYIMDDSSDVHTLTIDKLIEGIKLNHTKRPHSDKEQYDAEDYDCIIQYSVYGEMVYG